MKMLIILLFAMFTGSMAVFAQADGVILIADVSAIDKQRRELLVTPVFTGRMKTGVAPFRDNIIHIRLGWDLNEDEPFEALLPTCVFEGNRVKIKGGYGSDSVFTAEAVHGCSSGNYSDKTGVRSRLNRKNGGC